MAIDFWILARWSGWPPELLADAFLNALAVSIRDMMIAYLRLAMLGELIKLATKVEFVVARQ